MLMWIIVRHFRVNFLRGLCKSCGMLLPHMFYDTALVRVVGCAFVCISWCFMMLISVGGEPSSLSKGYLKHPRKSDSESATPSHNARETPLCFAGSRRYQRSPNEGLKRRMRRKLLGARRLRMQVEGSAPAVIRRPPRHHRHVSMSYWKRSKVVS
jgi:hypothetical protein